MNVSANIAGGGAFKSSLLATSLAKTLFSLDFKDDKGSFLGKFSPFSFVKKHSRVRFLLLAVLATPIVASANVQFWASGVTQQSGWQPDLMQVGNYCWAHTVSSIVGWWQDTSVNLPTSNAPRDRAELLKVFMASEPNSTGKHLDLALSWFFKEYYPTLDYSQLHRKIDLARNNDYKAESKAYYDAFSNGYPVGITLYGHAITGWGAEFKDANDPTSIQKIWITDSAYDSLTNYLEEYTRNYEHYYAMCQNNDFFCKSDYYLGFSRYERNAEGTGYNSVSFGTLLLDYLIPYDGTNATINPTPENPSPETPEPSPEITPNPQPEIPETPTPSPKPQPETPENPSPTPQPEPEIPAPSPDIKPIKLELIGRPIITPKGKLVLFFSATNGTQNSLPFYTELDLDTLFGNKPEGSFTDVLLSPTLRGNIPAPSGTASTQSPAVLSHSTLTNDYEITYASNASGETRASGVKSVSLQQKVIYESALAGALSVSSTHGALSQMLNSLSAQNLVAAGFESSQVKNFTGSWVKSTNSALNAAFAGALSENALVGAFVEAGRGDYETHNDFANAVIKGEGETKFIGGGVFVRLLGDLGHFDAAVRGGQVLSSYQASGFASGSAINELDLSRLYYGFLGEVGLNLHSKLEVFARASYTALDKDEANADNKDFQIDKIHSLIGTAGLKLSQNIGQHFKAYASAGVEREFLGEAKGRNLSENYAVNDYFKAPSMQGNSFVGELGLSYDGSLSVSSISRGVSGATSSKDLAYSNGVNSSKATNSSTASGFFANFKAQIKSGQNKGFGGGLDLGYKF